jgi:hypothetical protein
MFSSHLFLIFFSLIYLGAVVNMKTVLLKPLVSLDDVLLLDDLGLENVLLQNAAIKRALQVYYIKCTSIGFSGTVGCCI